MILVNNRDTVPWYEGMTVEDLLMEIGYTYVLISVTVNGTFVPNEEFDSFLIPDEADVKVIHVHHGG